MTPTEEFCHYLAWELKMTVEQMLQQMSLSEFLRWQKFLEKKAMLERGEQDPNDMDAEAFGKAFGAR